MQLNLYGFANALEVSGTTDWEGLNPECIA